MQRKFKINKRVEQIMPYKNFDDIPKMSSAIIFLFGIWASVLNYANRDNSKKSIWGKILSFLQDLLTSSGIAMLVFLTLTGYGLNEVLSAGISGFLAHGGTRAFYLAELIITEKLGADKTREDIKNIKL